jgi:hypothetical protein
VGKENQTNQDKWLKRGTRGEGEGRDVTIDGDEGRSRGRRCWVRRRGRGGERTPTMVDVNGRTERTVADVEEEEGSGAPWAQLGHDHRGRWSECGCRGTEVHAQGGESTGDGGDGGSRTVGNFDNPSG